MLARLKPISVGQTVSGTGLVDEVVDRVGFGIRGCRHSSGFRVVMKASGQPPC